MVFNEPTIEVISFDNNEIVTGSKCLDSIAGGIEYCSGSDSFDDCGSVAALTS